MDAAVLTGRRGERSCLSRTGRSTLRCETLSLLAKLADARAGSLTWTAAHTAFVSDGQRRALPGRVTHLVPRNWGQKDHPMHGASTCEQMRRRFFGGHSGFLQSLSSPLLRLCVEQLPPFCRSALRHRNCERARFAVWAPNEGFGLLRTPHAPCRREMSV